MDIAVELSLYPLSEQYLSAIRDFIERLHAYEGLKVRTDSMSTQISGDYTQVMHTLTTEMRRSFETSKKAAFVMKVLGPFAVS